MNIYKSKVDLWLFCLLSGSSVLPIFLVVFIGGPLWPALIICGATALFIVWLYCATKYEVTKDEIRVHAGLYKVKIPIKSIKSVAASRNPIASPAFSLDRLEIRYDQNSMILISPKDKNRFMADIGWLQP